MDISTQEDKRTSDERVDDIIKLCHELIADTELLNISRGGVSRGTQRERDIAQYKKIDNLITKYYRMSDNICLLYNYMRTTAVDIDTQGVFFKEFMDTTLGDCTQTLKSIDDLLDKYAKYMEALSNTKYNTSSNDLTVNETPCGQTVFEAPFDAPSTALTWVASHTLLRLDSTIKLSCYMILGSLEHTYQKTKIQESTSRSRCDMYR